MLYSKSALVTAPNLSMAPYCLQLQPKPLSGAVSVSCHLTSVGFPVWLVPHSMPTTWAPGTAYLGTSTYASPSAWHFL